jgi:ADP-ribose pyrophosphatase
MKKWEIKKREDVFKTPYFSVSKNHFSDSEGYQDDFYRFNFTDWVNIVPETASGELVMIRIFRFGIEDYCLEFPGGQVEKGADPLEAAKSELFEETGYIAEEFRGTAWAYPNPAIQGNKCFFYHATMLEKKAEQNLEQAEDITVVYVHKNEIPSLIKQNKITPGLSVLSYYYAMQLQ